MISKHLPFALSGGVFPRRLQIAWFAILCLSPLAYFSAAWIEGKLQHPPALASIDRATAIRTATAFAQTLGIDARGWRVFTQDQQHPAVLALYRRLRPPAVARLSAPVTFEVKMAGADARWVAVYLTPAGRVVGFNTPLPVSRSQTVDEARARAAAEEYLRGRLGADNPFVLGQPAVHDLDKQGWEREVVWEPAVPGLPRAKARLAIAVAGDHVFRERRSVELDPGYEKELRPSPLWRKVQKFGGVFYFLALGIYAIVRYVKRSGEEEISHRRNLLLVAGFVATTTILVGLSGLDPSSITNEPVAGVKAALLWVVMMLFLILGLGLFGLYFGVAYVAGEGDLREAYPGKLCSLDAFLAGKPFSANFGRAVLAGTAFAGWLLLVQNVVLLAVHAAPIGDVAATVNRFPLANLISDKFADIPLLAAFGLMLPLTFLRSHIRNRRLVYALLAPICILASAAAAPGNEAFGTDLFLDVIFAAGVLVPFFAGDLLASVTSIAALDLIGTLLRRSAISDEWRSIAYQHVLPVGLLFVAVAGYCAWRGRIYAETEVSPLYARHMARRLALTAEIGAARMAQLRLLPDEPPRIAGLSIAGSCTPAREVGGDFYDYYALDHHRLGLFLAEGGNRELGSAMTIALAKGFLLHTVRLDLAPVEVLRRLRATLSSVLRGDNAPMAVLYAEIDARGRSLRYARSGVSPRVLVNGNALAEEVVSEGSAGGIEIRHGAAALANSDALFFYTDGWAAQIAARARQAPDAFLRQLAQGRNGAPADALHAALLAAAFRRRNPPPDDVTAVVVRLEEAAAEAMGGIA